MNFVDRFFTPLLLRFWTFYQFHYASILLLFLLLVFAAVWNEAPFGRPIKGDIGYNVYLPALILHQDLTYQRVADEQFGGEFPRYTGVIPYPATDRYVIKYNVGTALFQAPFFMAAHFFTWLFQYPDIYQVNLELLFFNYPSDGFSFFYQYGVGLSGLFYMWLAMVILRRIAASYFGWSVATLLCTFLFFGTNLLIYATTGTTGYQGPLFLLYVLGLILIPGFWSSGGSRRFCILLGLWLGAIALLRISGLVVGIVWLLYGVSSIDDAINRLKTLWSIKWRLAMAAVVFLAVFSPQMLIWYITAGRWLMYSYEVSNEGFRWMSPHFFDVLFNVKAGVFFYMPVWLLGVIGLWIKKPLLQPWRLSTWMLWLGLVYVAGSWHMWWMGAGLGHRILLEASCLMIFPVGSLMTHHSKAIRYVTIFIAAASSWWYLFWFKLHISREIHIEGLDRQALFDLIWWRYKWLELLLQ